jgi:PEGA domain-containing protein
MKHTCPLTATTLTLATLITVAILLTTGCVERIIHVDSTPAGAIVTLNGQEIGPTPADTGFLWYGTYDVQLRLDGYEPLDAPKKITAPIYQWPLIDLFFEVFWPGTITDEHQWNFTMNPTTPADPNTLLESAVNLKTRLNTTDPQ